MTLCIDPFCLLAQNANFFNVAHMSKHLDLHHYSLSLDQPNDNTQSVYSLEATLWGWIWAKHQKILLPWWDLNSRLHDWQSSTLSIGLSRTRNLVCAWAYLWGAWINYPETNRLLLQKSKNMTKFYAEPPPPDIKSTENFTNPSLGIQTNNLLVGLCPLCVWLQLK